MTDYVQMLDDAEAAYAEVAGICLSYTVSPLTGAVSLTRGDGAKVAEFVDDDLAAWVVGSHFSFPKLLAAFRAALAELDDMECERDSIIAEFIGDNL